LLGFQKGAPEQVEVQVNTLEGFGEWSRERLTGKGAVSGTP
jgi:hypothetical protein